MKCRKTFIGIILVLWSSVVRGTHSGYFINLLQFPSLCPLTSFCASWNPSKMDKNLTLIQHDRIKLSVGQFFSVKPRGRLRSGLQCWSSHRLRKLETGKTGELCQLFSDSGTVICPGGSNKTRYFPDSRANRNIYMVPKSCVEWRRPNTDRNKIYYSEIMIEVPIMGRQGSSTKVSITPTDVKINDETYGWVKKFKRKIGLVTLKSTRSRHKIIAEVDDIFSLTVTESDVQGDGFLSMTMRDLSSFWKFQADPDKIGLFKEIAGLFGFSGFLETMYLAELSSKDADFAIKYGCDPTAWYTYRYPLCRCQYINIDSVSVMSPKEIRKQACCDWWLGRAVQGKEMGILPHGIKRRIYFNDRVACPSGTKPLSNQDSKCKGKFCCQKTELEVAQWDFKIREKCYVLRPLREEDGDGSKKKKERFYLGPAYGIMVLTFLFVLTFRYVTARLDECKANAMSGFQP